MTIWTIAPGPNLDTLRRMPDACVDSVVTDPPYGLNKLPSAVVVEATTTWLAGDVYVPKGKGFMGKAWDAFVPGPEVWREVLRVLKPGGHLLSFFGTRTYALGTIAIAMAGFEVRDQLAWMYGTGFPKSLDVSKAIDKAAGAEREVIGSKLGLPGYSLAENDTDEHGRSAYGKFTDAAKECQVTAPATPEAQRWQGWGTGLKPAQEPICLARKPLVGTVAANVLEHGTGGINVDGCKIETTDNLNGGAYTENKDKTGGIYGKLDYQCGTYTQPPGRWPANVLLDETAAAMLDEQTATLKGGTAVRRNNTQGGATSYDKPHAPGTPDLGYGDSGGASRFFYVAKASKAEREAGLDHLPEVRRTDGRETEHHVPNLRTTTRRNHHPTVKPIALMRYLVRLVTPPGGVVLDPYCGSGTTGIAAVLEGAGGFFGCELLPEYVEIARARIAHHERT